MPFRGTTLPSAALVLATMMLSCAGQNTRASTPLEFKLEVTSATVRHWAGGPAPIGGAHHIVHVVKPAGVALEITSIWVGDREKGRAPSAEIMTSGAVFTVSKIEADIEEFGIRFSTSYPIPPAKDPDLLDAPDDLPEEFVSGAVIWYAAGDGLSRYAIVDEFEELEFHAYP